MTWDQHEADDVGRQILSLPQAIDLLLRARETHLAAIATIDAQLETARTVLDDSWPRPRKKLSGHGWRMRPVPSKPSRRLPIVEAPLSVLRGRSGVGESTFFNDLHALERRGVIEKTLAGWRLTVTT